MPSQAIRAKWQERGGSAWTPQSLTVPNNQGPKQAPKPPGLLLFLFWINGFFDALQKLSQDPLYHPREADNEQVPEGRNRERGGLWATSKGSYLGGESQRKLRQAYQAGPGRSVLGSHQQSSG